MLGKKESKGLCPLARFKECNEKCVLFRKGTRYNEMTKEVTPVELCAFNIIADNIEQLHTRTYCLQKEMGETKNVMAFHVLAECGLKRKEDAARHAARALLPMVEETEEKTLPEK